MLIKTRCKGTTKYPHTQEKVVDIFRHKSLIINQGIGQMNFMGFSQAIFMIKSIKNSRISRGEIDNFFANRCLRVEILSSEQHTILAIVLLGNPSNTIIQILSSRLLRLRYVSHNR